MTSLWCERAADGKQKAAAATKGNRSRAKETGLEEKQQRERNQTTKMIYIYIYSQHKAYLPFKQTLICPAEGELQGPNERLNWKIAKDLLPSLSFTMNRFLPAGCVKSVLPWEPNNHMKYTKMKHNKSNKGETSESLHRKWKEKTKAIDESQRIEQIVKNRSCPPLSAHCKPKNLILSTIAGPFGMAGDFCS